MREVELKLAAPGSFVMPPLFHGGIGITEVTELPSLDMRNTYYDTADLRLARSRVTLRYRVGEEDGPRWTLKLPVPGDEPHAHDERHWTGPARRVPPEAADLARAYIRGQPLSAVASVRTRRHRWALRDDAGNDLAEIADDEVTVLDEERVAGRFRELEIEGRSIQGGDLERIADLLQNAGALVSEPIPKFVRALGARATAPPDVPAEISVAPTDPSGRAVQAALARGLRRLVVNDSGVRSSEDPERVHQMRVATRRLRSDLTTFAPLVDEEWASAVVTDLRWLGTTLGNVRDLDVQIERLQADSSDLRPEIEPLFESLAYEHKRAMGRLLEDLRSDHYTEVLDRLLGAASATAFTPLAQEPCVKVLPQLVGGSWRKLARAGRKLRPEDPDQKWHEVRIRAKRARYAAEAVAPALPNDMSTGVLRFAKRCVDLQDLLGELQDSVMSIAIMQIVSNEQPTNRGFQLAIGRLIERQAQRRLGARDGWLKYWAALDRKRNRKWLDG